MCEQVPRNWNWKGWIILRNVSTIPKQSTGLACWTFVGRIEWAIEQWRKTRRTSECCGNKQDQIITVLNDSNQYVFQLTQLETEKQSILDENSKLAEDNLTKEPELAEQKQKIVELSAQGKELCTKVQELLTQSSKISWNYSNIWLIVNRIYLFLDPNRGELELH